MVQKEISVMTSDEVKARLLNVATAYRDERLRNDDFEKALKESEKEISRTADLEVDLDN